MTYLILALLAVAAFGLFQTINHRLAHKQLEQERRQRYMQRIS